MITEYIIKGLILFLIGSVCGWIIEVIYRSIHRKRFVNPGFMSGCVLPIYGYGTVLYFIVCSLNLSFITENSILTIIIKVALCAFLATLVEFISGLYCEKVSHTRLWDYSNNFMNIKGYVCLRFTFYWAVVAVLYLLIVYKPLAYVVELIIQNDYILMLIAFFYGIFTVDFFYSIHITNKLRAYAIRIKEIINFEKIKENAIDFVNTQKGKHKFLQLKFNDSIARFIEEMSKKLKKSESDIQVNNENIKEKIDEKK